MPSPSLLTLLNSTLLLLLPLPAQTFTLPVLSTLLSPNATLNGMRQHCNAAPDWIGDGISLADCTWAIYELWRDDLLPRRVREYEFYTRGAPRLDFSLPLVLTPRSHEYGGPRGKIVQS